VVFLGFNIIAKTAIQKNPEIGINVRTILQPNVYYTCPAGKVAKVKGEVTCTGLGAAAQARFLINGTIAFRWGTTGVFINITAPDGTALIHDNNNNPFFTPLNVFRMFDFTLNAGEDFSTDQSSGTNSEFNVFAQVVESPA